MPLTRSRLIRRPCGDSIVVVALLLVVDDDTGGTDDDDLPRKILCINFRTPLRSLLSFAGVAVIGADAFVADDVVDFFVGINGMTGGKFIPDARLLAFEFKLNSLVVLLIVKFVIDELSDSRRPSLVVSDCVRGDNCTSSSNSLSSARLVPDRDAATFSRERRIDATPESESMS